ncbi:MAG: alpha/beta hydrolase [Cyanobacteria bacterium P01_H01_bin.21]
MEPLFWPNAGQLPVRNLRRKLKCGQIFWREIGRGQTVVFLHGSWCDGDQWSDVLTQLGQRYHCLAPDLIGFGESERLRKKAAYSIAMQVATLAELLESLRLKSVVLVGHSLGAWVAASYALKFPEQVKGLCVLAPEGLVYQPKRWRQDRWLVSSLGGLWLSITKPFARKSEPGRPSTWLKKHRRRQLLRRYSAACRLLFQRRHRVLAPEITSSLAGLSMPMVALQGERAGETCQQLTRLFTVAAPSAVVKTLPGDDELPSYQAEAIADFLEHWLSVI